MKPTRIIFFMWLAWALIVLGFQAWATARLELKYPDRAREWTSKFTSPDSWQGHVYLLEPFMNNQVAWDSEYYLAIAVGGYDDARSPHLTPGGVITGTGEDTIPQSGSSFDQSLSLSYAFFPFYPVMIRIFAFPLQVLGLNPIATAALAGVIVSALGALLGMLALHDYNPRPAWRGRSAARRLLPDHLPDRFLPPAGLIGRSVRWPGVCLPGNAETKALAGCCPARSCCHADACGRCSSCHSHADRLVPHRRVEGLRLACDLSRRGISFESLYHACLAVTPLIAFVIWKFSYLGQAFDYVQVNNFGRGFLSFGKSFLSWSDAFRTMVAGGEPQSSAYYLTEFLGLAIAIPACIICLRLDPELGWFSLAVVLISWGSGDVQGFHRYILGAPAVFIGLSRWGRNPVFDRAWTILSLLLMGTLAMLFAFNMWIA